jgi:hypothetical protein
VIPVAQWFFRIRTNCFFEMRPGQALLLAAASTTAVIGSTIQNGTKPNFIFIMTDDQDLHLDSIEYQKSVQKHFKQEGTWFKKHFCTVSLCCPSRVSLLTGKAAHNTNVTDVAAPYGKLNLQGVCSVEYDIDKRQGGILDSSRKASMMTTYQSGCRMPGTIHTTLAK